MVKTWRSSWFGEPGTRVLYALPQADTDRLLPLKLSPAPRNVVRVMVGRSELLTPEQEQQFVALLPKLAAKDPAAQKVAGQAIRATGRFSEPAITRIVQLTTDTQLKESARSLLRDAWRNASLVETSVIK